MKKTHKNAAHHLYKGVKVTLRQYMDISPAKLAKTTINRNLKKGLTLDEIDAKYNMVPKKSTVGESVIMKAAELANEQSERFKKIMSVPVNPKYTQAHYMKKAPIRGGEIAPVALKQNAYSVGY